MMGTGGGGGGSENYGTVTGTWESLTFSNCPAYKTQSGDTWTSLTELFYGTSDSEAVTQFSNNSGVGDPNLLDTGVWIWLPWKLCSPTTGGPWELICANVLTADNALTPDDLWCDTSGTCGGGTCPYPANGWCGY